MASVMIDSTIERKPRGAEFVFHRLVHHVIEDFGFEGQFDSIEGEEFDVLLRDGILRFGENIAQSFPIERIQIGEYRQAADDFGDQSEGFEVLRLDILHEIGGIDFLLVLHRIVTQRCGC